jgi:diguanylate cyclase (GGDEF)-like protein
MAGLHLRGWLSMREAAAIERRLGNGVAEQERDDEPTVPGGFTALEESQRPRGREPARRNQPEPPEPPEHRIGPANLAGQLREKLYRLRLELASPRAAGQQPHYVALHDGLTALPNRAHFRQRLGQALALSPQSGRPLGLICMGLNGAKLVTETHGQAVVDESLRIAAARLRHALRANDAVGRIGEVEFACMLLGLSDRRRLGLVARRLLGALGAPMRIGSIELSLSPNAGIVIFPGDGHGPDELLANAFAAMYRAKRQSCDHAFYGQPIGR